MSLSLTSLVATGGLLAGTSYLNARFGIGRDIKQLYDDRRWKKRVAARIKALGDQVTLYRLSEFCGPNAEALWFEGRTWSYDELRRESDALAEILYEHGVREDDFVAVLMANTPEMVFTIYALSKLGAAPAFVNTALRQQTLLHCLSIVSAKLVICTPDHTSRLLEISNEQGMPTHCISLSLGSFTDLPPQPESNPPNLITTIEPADLVHDSTRHTYTTSPTRNTHSVFCLIYTSGTSGAPKAVRIKANLFLKVSTPVPQDHDNPKKYLQPLRIYSCLPLFHGTGLFAGLCYAAGCGGTLCLGRRFNASGFSRALVEARATRMLYVGELARYLLGAPESAFDRAHKVKVATGNGMAGDVWGKFVRRFGIPEVREFYRSTEGVAKYDNFGFGVAMEGKVGFEGPIMRRCNDLTYLVRYDYETGLPWRDPRTGFCVRVKIGEAGEAIGRVVDLAVYSDYLNNPEANEKKLIRNVFEKGDLFQRMGDLLVRDKEGWITFMDRVGDTYRWRGENVSAGEVRDHISRLPEVQDVVVYGIKLPGLVILTG